MPWTSWWLCFPKALGPCGWPLIGALGLEEPAKQLISSAGTLRFGAIATAATIFLD